MKNYNFISSNNSELDIIYEWFNNKKIVGISMKAESISGNREIFFRFNNEATITLEFKGWDYHFDMKIFDFIDNEIHLDEIHYNIDRWENILEPGIKFDFRYGNNKEIKRQYRLMFWNKLYLNKENIFDESNRFFRIEYHPDTSNDQRTIYNFKLYHEDK